jgi:putative transposase
MRCILAAQAQMARGFDCLAVVVDRFSRRVHSCRLSITMAVDRCLEAVQEAVARYRRPELFNTDRGSRFTSAAFIGLLLETVITVSINGCGAWRENVFVERLWRPVKYQGFYPRACDRVDEA